MASTSRISIVLAAQNQTTPGVQAAAAMLRSYGQTASQVQRQLQQAQRAGAAGVGVPQSNQMAFRNRVLLGSFQQLSFGVEDFLTVFSQSGFAGGMRAAANNISMFGAAIHPLLGITLGLGASAAALGLALNDKLGGGLKQSAQIAMMARLEMERLDKAISSIGRSQEVAFRIEDLNKVVDPKEYVTQFQKAEKDAQREVETLRKQWKPAYDFANTTMKDLHFAFLNKAQSYQGEYGQFKSDFLGTANPRARDEQLAKDIEKLEWFKKNWRFEDAANLYKEMFPDAADAETLVEKARKAEQELKSVQKSGEAARKELDQLLDVKNSPEFKKRGEQMVEDMIDSFRKGMPEVIAARKEFEEGMAGLDFIPDDQKKEYLTALGKHTAEEFRKLKGPSNPAENRLAAALDPDSVEGKSFINRFRFGGYGENTKSEATMKDIHDTLEDIHETLKKNGVVISFENE